MLVRHLLMVLVGTKNINITFEKVIFINANTTSYNFNDFFFFLFSKKDDYTTIFATR